MVTLAVVLLCGSAYTPALDALSTRPSVGRFVSSCLLSSALFYDFSFACSHYMSCLFLFTVACVVCWPLLKRSVSKPVSYCVLFVLLFHVWDFNVQWCLILVSFMLHIVFTCVLSGHPTAGLPVGELVCLCGYVRVCR